MRNLGSRKKRKAGARSIRTSPAADTLRRKDSHLDLAFTRDVEGTGRGTLLDCVHLLHEALPELAAAELDTSVTFLGKRLRLPLLLTGMTGGTPRGQRVNLDLARAAGEAGCAIGVGSQRAMVEHPDRRATFELRAAAPEAAILGNVGLRLAMELGPAGVRGLMEAIGADGMAVHLNVGQEMIQPEGDRDFCGGVPILEALARELGERLVVKETGCGISPALAVRLADLGVRHIDVSGAGGTSWIRVESLRAEGAQARLGAEYSGWGIPTAVCVAGAVRALRGRAGVTASGGIRTGLDAARAIALGADLVGMALPIFRAQASGGAEAVREALGDIANSLRLAMLLTGSRNLEALRRAPRVVDGPLATWLGQVGAS